jgi:hypothetical protein
MAPFRDRQSGPRVRAQLGAQVVSYGGVEQPPRTQIPDRGQPPPLRPGEVGDIPAPGHLLRRVRREVATEAAWET